MVSPTLVISETAPFMKESLCRMVRINWPSSGTVTFVAGDRWYPTLRNEAKGQGIKVGKKALFKITLEYDFVCFECVRGHWKIVYRIGERVKCVLHDKDITTNITAITKNDLIFLADVPKEILVDTYSLEKVGDVWQFAKPPQENN
jgi:hypothetical protein